MQDETNVALLRIEALRVAIASGLSGEQESRLVEAFVRSSNGKPLVNDPSHGVFLQRLQAQMETALQKEELLARIQGSPSSQAEVEAQLAEIRQEIAGVQAALKALE
jgi:hypothetical protein